MAINVNEGQHYVNKFDSLHFKHWHSLLRLVHTYGLDNLGFDSRQVQGIFLFSQSALTSIAYLGCLAGIEAAGASSCQLTEVKSERRHSYTPPLCLHVLCRENFIFTFTFTYNFALGKNLQICKQDINVYIRAALLSFLQPPSLQQALLFSLSTNVTHFMEN